MTRLTMQIKTKIVAAALEYSSKDDPIHGAAIADIMGRDEQTVRSVINIMRQAGHPIASSAEGYWLAKEASELDTTEQHLSGRIAGIQLALEGIRAARARLLYINHHSTRKAA